MKELVQIVVMKPMLADGKPGWWVRKDTTTIRGEFPEVWRDVGWVARRPG